MKIEWKGGECPVSGDTKIIVWTDNGGYYEDERADNWAWHHDYHPNIIAYEVIEEDNPEKTLRDEFAMRAMQAYITSLTEDQEPIEHASGICEHSYLFADEMMKARAK